MSKRRSRAKQMKRFQMGKKTALTLLLGTFRPISGLPCANEETGNGYTTKECFGSTTVAAGEGCSYKHIEVGLRIQTVKLKIPGKLFFKVEYITSVTFKL